MGQKATVLGGDFLLKKKLGQGGMGAVYLAHQESLDRDCAIKILSKELAAKPGFKERFLREARSMAKIDHPNVVTCFAVGEDKGFNYVAMELMDGQSMQDWLDHLQKIPVSDAVLVTIIAAEALHHAHELNMIHRDIKPDNLLVTKKGVVKVADMGLAKAVDDEDMSLTQSGTGLGTPHYMPPEQARNAKHVDRRCDVYALGCTLYHFVTGKTPFEGDSIVELITNKETGRYTPAKRFNSDVTEKLDLIIGKAMERDPKNRFQTCQELAHQLESLCLAGESLSFIDEKIRVIARRSGSSPTMAALGATAASIPGQKRSAEVRQRRSSEMRAQKRSGETSRRSDGNANAVKEGQWYVRYEGSSGVKVGKMTTPQVLQAIRSDKLNASTKVSQSAKGTFLPLAQVPYFEDEAKKMLTRQQNKARGQNLQTEYAKLAKQYDRRKWWQFFGKIKDGTLGIVGLIIWLVAVCAVLIGGYFLVTWGMDNFAGQIGLEKGDSSTAAEATE